jgi:hypothetical protein
MIHTLTVALILSTAGAAVPIAAGMNAAALPAELSAEALGRYLSHRSPLQQKTTEYGYSDSLVRSLKSITERSWRGRCSGMLGARDASSRVPLIGICDLVTSLSARQTDMVFGKNWERWFSARGLSDARSQLSAGRHDSTG